MDWLLSLRSAIAYIEENLQDENLSVSEVAKATAMSELFLQHGFSTLTGASLGELSETAA